MPTLLRILFLEDRQTDVEIIQRHLRDEGLAFTPQCVSNELDFLSRLRNFDPDVILADYALPQYDGLSALQSVQEIKPDTPFIFVSGTMGEEVAIESLRGGATDYVLKSNLARLGTAVKRAIREKSEERRRREAEATLRRSEEHFRLLYDESPVAYQSLDREGRVLQANDAWLSRLGYSSEEVLGRPITDFMEPSQVALFSERFPEFLKAGRMSGAEFVMRRQNGSTLVVSVDGRVSCDAAGEFKQTHCVLHDITKRKLAEEALRASEQNYREIFNASSDLIILHDEETGAILDANQAALEFFGVGLEELQRRTFGDLGSGHAPYAHADALEWLRKAIQEGPQIFKWRAGHHQGDQRWLEVALRSSKMGGEGRVLAVFRDITERQRAQEALAAERNLLRIVTDNLPDLICVKDLKEKYLFVNEAHLSLPNVNALDQVLQHTAFDLYTEDIARRIHEDDQMVLQTGKALYNRVEARGDRQGQERWLLTTKVPLLDASGRIMGLVGISRDITDRRKAEESLRQSQQRLALHIQQTPLAVIEWDLEFRVTAWNPAAEQIFGFTAEEAVGRSGWGLIVSEKVRPRADTVWKALLAKKGGIRNCNENVTKDGRSILCEWYNTPLVDASGRVIAVASLCWDITERREAEETRLRLEAQLRQAQKMEAVGQLAGGVAHDFNNILTVILGNANLLVSEPGLAPGPGELAGHIAEAAERAAGLTRHLLAFSRQQVLQMQSIDLNEVVSRLANMLGRLLGEQIALKCHHQADLPPVEADAGMLDQVILNLAINARDAMPDGGELTVATGIETVIPEQAEMSAEARPGRFVTLTVTDCGIGMGSDTKLHLFEPFFTTKEVGKGTGLGLATVYGIVKQHQGWIEVESQVGQGSTFKVYLPPSAKAIEEAAPDQPPPEVVGGDETILVVEDDPNVRLLVQTCLRRYGYRILEAGNGAEALKVWARKRDQIDLLLTDLVMPEGMTGRDLANRLKTENPKLKVIFTSGYSRDVLKAADDFLQGDDYLSKPFKPAALARSVRARLDAV